MTTDDLLADETIDLVVVATSHDTHAALVVKALESGKHVFCEKPLALSEDELENVVSAWEHSGRQLAVGFNRRHSPWIRKAIDVLQPGAGPLVINYRANAGALPAAHWYHDRRQGGRLIGEVCHFVDTCNALVGASADAVSAFGGGRGEAMLAEDIVVTLRYPDGSVAAITYATSGHVSTAEERIEILAVVTPSSSTISSPCRWMGKSRRAHATRAPPAVQPALAAMLQTHDDSATSSAIDATRTCLAAVESIRSGLPVRLQRSKEGHVQTGQPAAQFSQRHGSP